jgi:hypothetical protein
MIKTVGDFLSALANAETLKLAATGITHPTVIGSMYEGLTRDILERAIPDGLDLQVVDGFVMDDHGKSSGQIDCMLVRGSGTPVPFVHGTYQWHVKDVIAVFEVKKNLFGADLSDAFVHLRGVLDRFSAYVQNPDNEASFDIRATYKAFAQTTGDVAPPGDRLRTMPPDRHLIFHTMMADQIAPIRVIFGYGGYSTELGLRTGFLDYLASNLNKLGFGPPSMPNLIVAGGSSLVKLSGHPYHVPLRPDGRWPLIASSSDNPLHFLLELIWTRLSNFADVASFFGDDLDEESMSPLLDVQPVQKPENPDQWGWMFTSIQLSKKQLEDTGPTRSWQPVELDQAQFTIVNLLCSQGENIDDPGFLSYVATHGRSPEEFVDSLVRTTLVARNGRLLELTTSKCECVILPDGRYVAAENSTGRLTRWVDRYFKQRDSKAGEDGEDRGA